MTWQGDEPSTSGRARAPTRSIKKGAPTRTEGYKPTCSIPAKFETLLYQGPRERKGFGSEGRRFGSDETDNPGPGTYKAPAHESGSQESMSKKGFGGLASHTNRFKHKARYTGPGPGSYAAAPTQQTNFFHVAPMSAFHPKVPKVKDVSPQADPLPGPGAYNNTITRTGKTLDFLSAPNSHNSAFKAPGHKLALSGNLDSPGPTKYSLTDPWDASSKGGAGGVGGGGGGARSGSHACTSSFAGRSMASLSSVPAVVFLDQGGGGGEKPDTGPGPGSYNAGDDFKATLARAAVRPSAMFQPPEHIDRFAQPLAQPPRPPPPAGMHIGKEGADSGDAHSTGPAGPWDASKSKGVSAPFRSKAPAHIHNDMHELARAPGPAYYGPVAAPQGKSFHVNARNKFVPMIKA